MYKQIEESIPEFKTTSATHPFFFLVAHTQTSRTHTQGKVRKFMCARQPKTKKNGVWLVCGV
jgi:hypothetical protein